MLNIPNNKKVSLDLLRAILSFSVVYAHFGSSPSSLTNRFFRFFYFIIGYFSSSAVPIFMLMSFFLVEKTITFFNKELFQKRLKRLLLPYILWAFIYALAYLSFLLLKKSSPLLAVFTAGKALLWQLLLGSSEVLNPPLWFHSVLIFATVFFILLSYLLKTRDTFSYILLFFFSIFLQYSLINFNAFKTLPYEVKWTLGRTCEMLPYCVTGLLLKRALITLKSCDIGSKGLKQFRGQVLLFLSLSLIFLLKYQVFNPIKEGFMYQGASLFIKSILLFAFFYTLPLNALPNILCKIIQFFSKYFMGIYCIHFLVGRVYLITSSKILVKSGINSTGGGGQFVIIYLISLFLCIILYNLPIKRLNFFKRLVT